MRSSPINFRNPSARACALLGGVVCALAANPGMTIPGAITTVNKNNTRCTFIVGLILRRAIAVR